MSRVDELAAGLGGVGGVGLAKLGELFDMRSGRFVAAADIAPFRDSGHPFPCYGGNGLRGYVSTASHRGARVLVGRQGALSGNVHRVTGEFYATEHAVVVEPTPNVDVQWAFHMLTAMNLNQYVSHGAQPGLAVGTLKALTTRVPSLETQRHVASILDAFTELEAELEARRRQYEHYSQQVISSIAAPWVRLGDLGHWRGGVTPSKAVARYWESGDIPWLASMDVSGTESNQIRGRVTSVALDETSLKVIPAPCVVVVMRSNILRRRLPVGLVTIPTTINQDVRALIPHDGVDANYVYQALQTASEAIRESCVRTDGSMAAVDSKSFFGYEIPLPSFSEQQLMAKKLRAFDALVNDLTVGLPAELAARRKQYEYYRDKLLTFKEAPA